MELAKDEKIESLEIEDYKIIQSEKLYRFTSDAVYLSRFVKPRSGEVVADLCSGSGIVGLHFYALNAEKVKEAHLFELQKPLADLSQKSVELNKLENVFTVHNQPIQEIDNSFDGKFSLVVCNPPYKKQSSGLSSKDESIAVCKHEISVTIEDIAKVSSRILRRGGRIALCNKCERLVDVITAFMANDLHPSRLEFLSGNRDCAPYLFFIEATKTTCKQLKIENMIANTSKNFSGN